NGGTSCATLLSANWLSVSTGGRLLLSDQRVLIFNNIPTSNGVSADIVIGQPDCFTRVFTPVTSSSISNAVRFVTEINNNLFVSDGGNSRVLIFPNTTGTGGSVSTPLLN